MIQIPPEFKHKLIEKGAHEKFITNITEYEKIHSRYFPCNLHLHEGSFSEYIAHAFVWDATPEGYGYWNEIASGIEEN